MSYIRINPILGYSAIFDENLNLPSEHDLRENIKWLISGLSRNTVLRVSTHFAGYFDYEKSSFNRDSYHFLLNYFQYTPNVVKEEILRKVADLHKSSIGVTQIINTHTSLTLFNWAFDLCEGAEETTDDERANLEITLLKAYLYLNEVLDASHAKILDTINDRGLDGIIQTQFTVALPDYEFSNVRLENSFMCQVVKAFWLFQHIQSNPKYTQLIEALLKKVNASNVSLFHRVFVLTAWECITRTEGAFVFSVDSKDDEAKRVLEFVQNVSGSQSDDFANLRRRPVLEMSDGRYAVIYPLFLIDKIYKSWYFQLNEVNKELDSPPFNIDNFKSDYGKAITEEVIVASALSGLFRNSAHIRFGPSLLNEKGKEYPQAPDYYVRDSNKVFWFESKDTYLTARSKTSYNYSNIEADARKKLRSSGISQLVANIQRIFANGLEFDTITRPDKTKIFPLLVLHDETFNSPFFNYLVNQWFFEDLYNSDIAKSHLSNVNPVVILTIDTLITFSDLFKSSALHFEQMLRRYGQHHLKPQEGGQFVTGWSFFQFAQSFGMKKDVSIRPNRDVFQEALRFLVGPEDDS